MFSRKKNFVKLTVECIDAVDSDIKDAKAAGFGIDIETHQIHALSELNTLYDSIKAQHETEKEHKRTHRVEFNISGAINGEVLDHLKIASLEKLHEFIHAHSPDMAATKHKGTKLGFISPLL